MYSEHLDNFIQAVIADGVITDKEREVLHKKATAEGIDLDEIDIYVDGLLAARSATTPTAAPAQEQEDTAKTGDFSLLDALGHPDAKKLKPIDLPNMRLMPMTIGDNRGWYYEMDKPFELGSYPKDHLKSVSLQLLHTTIIYGDYNDVDYLLEKYSPFINRNILYINVQIDCIQTINRKLRIDTDKGPVTLGRDFEVRLVGEWAFYIDEQDLIRLSQASKIDITLEFTECDKSKTYPEHFITINVPQLKNYAKTFCDSVVGNKELEALGSRSHEALIQIGQFRTKKEKDKEEAKLKKQEREARIKAVAGGYAEQERLAELQAAADRRKEEAEQQKKEEFERKMKESEAKFRQKYPKVAEWADTFGIEIRVLQAFGCWATMLLLLLLFVILLGMCSD